MATLYVRDMPDDLYERLRSTARNERRSIGATAVEILSRELSPSEELSMADFLTAARRIRARSPRVDGAPTVAEDIRADRER